MFIRIRNTALDIIRFYRNNKIVFIPHPSDTGVSATMTEIDILHMASYARSGETLMLRTLAAHPQIKIVHQLRHPDTAEDVRLFEFLTKWEAKTIPSDHPAVAHIDLRPGDRLLLKSGVWEHRYPFKGFVLVRNPFSVLSSLLRYAADHKESETFQKDRLVRWASRIDPELTEQMRNRSIVDASVILYMRRMMRLADLGLPILRYEDFSARPRETLTRLLERLGLEFDDRLLRAHENYPPATIGHGGCPLSKPLTTESTHAYGDLPPEIFDRVLAIAAPALYAYGYEVDRTARRCVAMRGPIGRFT